MTTFRVSFARMCPGRWLAIDTIWIAVATAAAVFDISAPLDAEGRPVQQTVEYTSTLLRYDNIQYTETSEDDLRMLQSTTPLPLPHRAPLGGSGSPHRAMHTDMIIERQ